MSKGIISIDPGNTHSGIIVSPTDRIKIIHTGKWENEKIRKFIRIAKDRLMIGIVEIPVIFGKATTLRDTLLETGRFIQLFQDMGIYYEGYPRSTIKNYFASPKKVQADKELQKFKSMDAKLRCICKRRVPKEMLTNVKKDAWQALILLLYWMDKQNEEHS